VDEEFSQFALRQPEKADALLFGRVTYQSGSAKCRERRGGSVRSLVVVEYVSLDGVIQAPGHAGEDRDGGFAHGGWTGGFMADHRRHNSQLSPPAGAFLLGRRTYEIFAAYWPTVTDRRDQIAHALNSRPKYVVSTTLRGGRLARNDRAHR
jgi:dihydrofolate reductase